MKILFVLILFGIHHVVLADNYSSNDLRLEWVKFKTENSNFIFEIKQIRFKILNYFILIKNRSKIIWN